ncbi:hypothetical protein D3C78_536120 [compost metagenome]
MAGQLLARHVRRDYLEQPACIACGASTDGVAQRDFVAAHVMQGLGHRGDLFGTDPAFIRAAEHAGNVTAHPHTVAARRLHDRLETLEALTDRTIDVALGERFGGGGEHCHFLHSGRQGVFEPSQVGRQGRIGNTRALLDSGKHVGRAGHLRHPFGRNETADFNVGQPGVGKVVDQAHLVRDTDGLGFVLQAVARADFDQADFFGQRHGGVPVAGQRLSLLFNVAARACSQRSWAVSSSSCIW